MEALIYLLIFMAIAGFIVYLIVTYIPMPQIFKTVIIVAAAVGMLLLLLHKVMPLRGVLG